MVKQDVVGEQLFEELADNAPVMIWRAAADKRCDFFNAPWLQFTGRPMEKELGAGWMEGVHPDDLDRCLEVYQSAFDSREAFSLDYRLQRHDGVYRWITANGKPFNRNGQFAGYLGSCIDVHDRREIGNGRKDLLSELNHRVKNVLATVQALVRQSLSSAAMPKDAEQRLTTRLMVLATTQELLADNGWRGADLKRLAERILRLAAPSADRMVVDGPEVFLVPAQMQSLAMAFCELGLNARQHGAWSSGEGRTELHWEWLEPDRLHFRWQEYEGPVVSIPQKRGFGLRLLQGMLPGEAGGKTDIRFESPGLRCDIALNIAKPPESSRSS
jgi:PAS domain S-box-containing protein